MTDPMHFSPRDRLLVFAPHPDDETIATGELLQAAREAGTRLQVVFATDGENNPWPQRWLERRWRIGPAERARWGQRRRREGIRALAALGINEACVRFLGWPDQGLTDRLMRDDSAVVALREAITAFRPTHVAMPTLADRHPDHGALRVMVDLALLRAGVECIRLGYTVHGTRPPTIRCGIAPDPSRHERKHAAMQAHRSQIVLSGGRLLGLAARPEEFELGTQAGSRQGGAFSGQVRLPHRSGWWWRRRSALLLLLSNGNETLRYRFVLPRLPRRDVASTLFDREGRSLQVVWEPGALGVTLPKTAGPIVAVHAKFHRLGERLVIFDHERWLDGADLFQQPVSNLRRNAAAESG